MGWGGNPLLGYWRRMCEQPTTAEAALEPAIAALGERYRHQYPFWGLKYFADFALLDRKLIIEVDGASHDKPAQKEKDLKHSLEVLKLGWYIYRCSNEWATKYPEESVDIALQHLAEFGRPQNREFLAEWYQGQLVQLHLDYPALLAVVAKKSRPRRPPVKASASPRRKRAAPDRVK